MNKLSEIKASSKDIIVAPYFRNIEQDNIGLSNFFYVKLKQESDVVLLEREAEKVNAIIDHQNEFMSLWYVLSVTENSEFNAMELSNQFYESGLFQYAEPDLLVEDELYSADEYYSDQWNLKNTGQYGGTSGVDIKTEQAWMVSTGLNVTVAIIDDGIDLGHPDLVANIHSQSFDSELGTLTNPVPQIIKGYHGTAVAGIVGAVRNNYAGIAGVAPGCKIMSISNDIVNTTFSREKRANGINWAWRNGADVINNSWGSSMHHQVINDAIRDAVTKGRDGKGCVVVFASGNDSFSTVGYPASLSDVIAVGAINNTGTKTSISSYGTALDIVAPGTNIPTTDLRGADGYSSTDYDMNFYGTSAAAPHVASVAALILSKNPIIESTAQKIGGYTYSPSNYNGTWNNQMGHGLVNAYAAVSGASHSVSLPQTINIPQEAFAQVYDTYSYSGGSIPSGSTFNGWDITPYSGTIAGQSGNSVQIKFLSAGKYTVTANFTMPGNIPYVLSKTVDVSPAPVLGPMTGPDVVYSGQTYVSYNLNRIEGFTYTWGSSGILIQVSNNGLSEGLFNVLSSPGSSSDNVHCTVTTSDGTVVGIFYMTVYIFTKTSITE